MDMVTLATNKAKKDFDRESANDHLEFVILDFVSFFFLIYVAFIMKWTIPLSWAVRLFIFVPLMILMIYSGLKLLDGYMRFTRAVETVSVHQGMLVIECRGGIYNRRKEIPLSAIQKVEPFDGKVWWYRVKWCHLTMPERLRVDYSGSKRYYFGICLDKRKRNALAKKIQETINTDRQ